jgi:hypothetical protein
MATWRGREETGAMGIGKQRWRWGVVGRLVGAGRKKAHPPTTCLRARGPQVSHSTSGKCPRIAGSRPSLQLRLIPQIPILLQYSSFTIPIDLTRRGPSPPLSSCPSPARSGEGEGLGPLSTASRLPSPLSSEVRRSLPCLLTTPARGLGRSIRGPCRGSWR